MKTGDFQVCLKLISNHINFSTQFLRMDCELWIMNDCVFCVAMNIFPPKFKDLLMPNAGSRTVCELKKLEK